MGDDLKDYIVNSNKAVDIIFAYSPCDMVNPIVYKPLMSHQIFDRESIFGYNNLKITLFYSAYTFHCFVKIKYDDKWSDHKLGIHPDNIVKLLQPWLRDSWITDKDEFLRLLHDERVSVHSDKVLKEFIQDKNNYVFAAGDLTDSNFKSLHKRFESLIIMYIDAANFIDLKDNNWHLIYLYEKNTESQGKVTYLPIGYCSFYMFHQRNTGRISQFFIIPKFQKKGLGKLMLRTVYDYLYNTFPKISKITVESPNEAFSFMRDKVDAERFIRLKKIDKEMLRQGFTSEISNMARKNLLMTKKQAQHIYEIVRYYYEHEGSEYFDAFKSEFINRRQLEYFGVKYVEPSEIDDYLESFLSDKNSLDEIANIPEEFEKFLLEYRPVVNYLKRQIV